MAEMSVYPTAREMGTGVAVESKICEGGCGQRFLREVPMNAKSGCKMCERCRRLGFEERERVWARSKMQVM